MFDHMKRMFAAPSASASGPSHADVGREFQVKKHRVVVDKFLAEGGFAVVYIVHDEAGKQYALKKMNVHNQDSLDMTHKEVKLMERVSGHQNIVGLIAWDSRPSAGHFMELLVLMELCPGGTVTDIMNRRLDRHFEEKEVLKIFSDVCLGVAALHKLDPPVIHRDIKLENVLLGVDHGSFKLCDFGSATEMVMRPGDNITVADAEDNIGRFTTLQYRAPEMVDLYCGHEIGLKADIWALGCLLFKLCFFTDAFEESTLSVLSGRYRIPATHKFSNGLVKFLDSLLQLDPADRPTIEGAVQRVFALRGLANPLATTRAALPKQKSETSLTQPCKKTPAGPRRSASNPFVAGEAAADPFASNTAAGTAADPFAPSGGGRSSGQGWANFQGAEARNPFGAAGGASTAATAPKSKTKPHAEVAPVPPARRKQKSYSDPANPFADPAAAQNNPFA
eukprot:m.95315 g.95315  ORF g.95315 m.95315 type:complete len:450 (-) comp15149_c0_seq1:588-1937(-)